MPTVAASTLALVTTIHLAMAALRNHRTASAVPVSPLAVVSFALGSFPWLFPSVTGLIAGVLGHIAWFAACERFGITPSAQPAARPGAPRVTGAGDRGAPAVRSAAPASVRLERPTGFVQAAVLATFDETPTVRTIRLARPDGFDFRPGQFITVRLRVDGRDHARCYSISSAPHVRGYLEISVKRQGLISNALHATLRPGAAVFIKGPLGAFTYPAGDDRPMVLLAGGIGVTPLASMLRHAVAAEPGRPVTLLYAAHREDELAFRDELEAIARRHPQVQLRLAVSGSAAGPACYPGRLDERLLRKTVPDLQHSIALVCGPLPMIEATRALLAALGVPPTQIRFEVFEAAVAASAGTPTAPTPRRPATHQMRCRRLGRCVPVQPGQTLLDAAEAGGVDVPSLCRAGVCGTCRVAVAEGEVSCESATLDAAEREQGLVLACVTTAQSDCVVDL